MKFVAVAACPAGLMHTFMAASGLKKAAKKAGATMHVETQSASGIEDQLTAAQISEADAVVLAIDVNIEGIERFAGKPTLTIGTNDVLANAKGVIAQLTEMGAQANG
ncbi:PTS fructose transporter subunit IIB [Lacticaseibacillus daqingensis]|uniref:PTS fructose transporter subunit IIB n=1 Tax=Lacticaseibacillus daqingensis TaxID=2486014 RepID=UPI000F7660CB|nr:fructose PTS transporter subunit IIB [Lacticaseibacillus daqingensis]